MRIGFFIYSLSGVGPRTRARHLITVLADETDHEIVLITGVDETYDHDAIDVHRLIDTGPTDLVSLYRSTRREFADVDLVHVPVNMYQALFVRTAYSGPFVAGPGMQHDTRYRYLAKLIGIDKIVETHEFVAQLWEKQNVDTTYIYPCIDESVFRPYDEERVAGIRSDLGIPDDHDVLLYVGSLSEFKGAHLVDEMATELDETETLVVVGDGDLRDRFEDREDLMYEGFVENRRLPRYYNVADVTLVPSRAESFSIVSLESVACGTPVVTTTGDHCTMYKLFHDRGTYVWADERTAPAILDAVRSVLSDPDRYRDQVETGFATIDEMNLTMADNLQQQLAVYEEVVGS